MVSLQPCIHRPVATRTAPTPTLIETHPARSVKPVPRPIFQKSGNRSRVGAGSFLPYTRRVPGFVPLWFAYCTITRPGRSGATGIQSVNTNRALQYGFGEGFRLRDPKSPLGNSLCADLHPPGFDFLGVNFPDLRIHPPTSTPCPRSHRHDFPVTDQMWTYV